MDKVENTPFYEQLKIFFIEEIESGKLKTGDKLPSEREIAERFNVSRMTARHALSILEREGFVERIVGAGTFVTNKRIQMDFITFSSFTNVLLSKGLVPLTQILETRREIAKATVAKALGINNDEEVVIIKRLRFANGIPISIQVSHIPYKYCKDIEQYIKDNVSLYDVLEDHYGIKLVKTKQFMRVSLSDENESRLLNIRKESPCIYFEETTSDSLGRAIEFSQLTTRSDIVNYYSEQTLTD
jgi:GntR family transcriptional regulator